VISLALGTVFSSGLVMMQAPTPYQAALDRVQTWLAAPAQNALQFRTGTGAGTLTLHLERGPQTSGRIELKGLYNQDVLVFRQGMAMSVDHRAKRYERFPGFTMAYWPDEDIPWVGGGILPALFEGPRKAALRAAPGGTVTRANGQVTLKNSISLGAGKIDITIVTDETGRLIRITEHTTGPGVDRQDEFREFKAVKADPNPKRFDPNLLPAGYTPVPNLELQWPALIGEKLPPKLSFDGKPLDWNRLGPPSKTLLLFVQPGQRLSDQVMADAKGRQGQLSAKQVRVAEVRIGATKGLGLANTEENRFWIGLAGTPVFILVDKDQTVLWVHQGYGPKTKEQAWKRLTEFLAESSE